MVKLLLIGTGGFLGSVSRYLLGSWLQRIMNHQWFPFGTLSVNLIGCVLIGLYWGFTESRGGPAGHWEFFAVIGFLGGFTTFSTFGYDGFSLMRQSMHFESFLYIAAHLILGLMFVFVGHYLARFI